MKNLNQRKLEALIILVQVCLMVVMESDVVGRVLFKNIFIVFLRRRLKLKHIIGVVSLGGIEKKKIVVAAMS